MKAKRRPYILNVNEFQMKELMGLVKQKRQELHSERNETGEKNTIRVAKLQGLEKALERAVYFYNKHTEKPSSKNDEEDDWWQAIK